MTHTVLNFWRNQSGATAIEYAMIASLIALAIIAAASNIGTKLSATLNNVKSNLR